jgi:hypothetical protein
MSEPIHFSIAFLQECWSMPEGWPRGAEDHVDSTGQWWRWHCDGGPPGHEDPGGWMPARDYWMLFDMDDTVTVYPQEQAPVALPAPPAPPAHQALTLVPGGYTYLGKPHNLGGRPLAMLQALLDAPDRRLTADKLRVAMRVDDESVEHPDQVIRDTATDLRRSLRNAVKAAGLTCANPLPSSGRGCELVYWLDLP